MLLVSEFIRCSPSLSGAIRVNPWNIDVVVEVMNVDISIPEAEVQLSSYEGFNVMKTIKSKYLSMTKLTNYSLNNNLS